MKENKFLILLILLLSVSNLLFPQSNTKFSISGKVLDAKDSSPLIGATVIIEDTYLWSAANDKGDFIIKGAFPGQCILEISCMGFVTQRYAIDLKDDVYDLVFKLSENSLALKEVVVTAQQSSNKPNTAYRIGGELLKHTQVSDIANVAALLPGGKTVNPDLTQQSYFSVRSGGSSAGNAEFGTAVEVDGIRIGSNSSFGQLSGASTRSISTANIESVEVITGVPSAEYGDLNSGLVKVNTKKGKSPLNIVASINPRMQQVSVYKGVDLGGDKGIINVSGEWARATKKLVSPYETYNRYGITLGYNKTFNNKFRFEANFMGNLGGMNSKDDPDAFKGEYSKERDNVLRGSINGTWLLNKSWITNLKFNASINYNDLRTHIHKFYSYASEQPSVSSTDEGYFVAGKLPLNYFADQIVDSKELQGSASIKYEWNRKWEKINNRMIAGVQWKTTGNVGKGEYYDNPSLSPNGFRPWDYNDYPFMNNLAYYIEDNINFKLGKTNLEIMAGVRFENIFISNTKYKNLNTVSPRLNARWTINDIFSIRGGWGITEKLPSFYILFPRQQYRDIQTFAASYGDNKSFYVYHSQPYTLSHNENLKWQKNDNSEIGFNVNVAGFRISLTGFKNVTKLPYSYTDMFTPFTYSALQMPNGFVMPSNPDIVVDNTTGMVYVRGDKEEYYTPMSVKVTDNTFVKNEYADNGEDITRNGMELVVDFPQINPILTSFRLDASYAKTKFIDARLYSSYNTGWSHTSEPNKSYEFVGLYANGGSGNTTNGKITRSMDMNITSITHIPRARLVFTVRLELTLLKRMQNLSTYNGAEYAFNVSNSGKDPIGGSIYDGESYSAIYPVRSEERRVGKEC